MPELNDHYPIPTRINYKTVERIGCKLFSGPFTPMSISEMFFTEIYSGDYHTKSAIDFWRNVPENLVLYL